MTATTSASSSSPRRSAVGLPWVFARTCLPGLVALGALAGCSARSSDDPPAQDPPGERVYRLEGGRWWTGSDFVPRTPCVANGIFLDRCPQRVDSVLDLGDRWIVPPYAEGHTHTIAYVPSRIAEFVEMGIFYALVLNVHVSAWAENRSWFEGATTPDVAAAAAGFTAPGGHPVQIGLRGDATLADIDGDWIAAVRTEEDVERHWHTVSQANDDVIKTFLVDSERYEELAGRSSVAPRYRGMDPRLLPGIVRRAHAEGLRVATHVRTAYDFHVAVAAGVDIVAHLPGFSMGPGSMQESGDPDRIAEIEEPERFTIDPSDARAAARQGTTVITTVGSLGPVPEDLPSATSPLLARLLETRRSVIESNLRVLESAGVVVALGSDAGEGNVVTETLLVDELGVFDRAELLRMLTSVTPRLIFPERRIGSFDPGFEASLLALERNPIDDLEALRDVTFRMKEGVIVAEGRPAW